MGEYEPNDSRNVTGTGSSAPQGEGVRSAGGADQQQGNPRWNGDGEQEQMTGQSGSAIGGGWGSGAKDEGVGNAGAGQTDATGISPPADQIGETGNGAGLAGQIREHMDVIGADGVHVGTVDHVDGDRIKLTKKDSGAGFEGGSHEGHHHYLPLGLVAGIEGDTVRLSANGDVAYGMEEEEDRT